jgi:hypothetical protein
LRSIMIGGLPRLRGPDHAERHRRGHVAPEQAKSWGAKALAGREFVVLQPASREPIYLRMIETDTAQLAARLNGAPLRVIGPPRSRACATPGAGPASCSARGEYIELI